MMQDSPESSTDAEKSTEPLKKTSENAEAGSSSDIEQLRTFPAHVPILCEAEVTRGSKLGNGSYCVVFAVKKIALKDNWMMDGKQEEARRRVAELIPHNLGRHNLPALDFFGRPIVAPASEQSKKIPRIALKQLKDVLSGDLRSEAARDLQREMDILLAVGTSEQHKNIVDLHAVGVKEWKPDGNPQQIGRIQPTFLVLGRVKATLNVYLNKWRDRRGLGLWETIGWGVENTRDLWLERLMVLVQIADVLRFLHSKRIVYRDLKCDNIGFNDDDIPKLFDFGLAKELPASTSRNGDDTYQLTGETGSLRYMAPESACHIPYGLSVDVYSLAILMHEILSLKTPFANVPPSMFIDVVFQGGERPPIDASWPEQVKTLLISMWDKNPQSRPSAEEVVHKLEGMLRGSDAELFPAAALTTNS